jgi:hypothetical protein
MTRVDISSWPMDPSELKELREWVRKWALDPRFEYLLDQTPDNIDAGIIRTVLILAANGVETYESCQSGPGHCMLEPTVKFYGGQSRGFHALAVAEQFGLGVTELRRVWTVLDGEPTGPQWELTFRPTPEEEEQHG